MGVVDEGDPTRHPGGEVPAGGAEHHDPSAGHVLAAVVAHALDDRGGAGVAHAEALPDHAAQVRLATGGAVQGHVARDHVLLGHERRVAVGAADHDATREPFAEVVVGVAFQQHRDAPGHEGTEALPRGPAEVHRDRAVGQAVASPLPRDRVPEQGPGGAVHVADRELDLDPLATLDRGRGQADELLVECALEPVVLRFRAVEVLTLVRVLGHGEDRREVEAVRLPVVDRAARVEHLGMADCLRDRAEAERGEVLAHFFGEELEEVHDELGLAGEPLAQLGVLGGDADRARVEVAHAHHHAAAHHERRGREAELLGTEQGRDHDVAPGFQLAVALHDDAITQPVLHEGLLGLGDPELPRRAGVLERRER